jgi:hypothetical protein
VVIRKAAFSGHPPKLADVAAQAAVSTATAPPVLNGSDRFVGELHRGRCWRRPPDR